MNKNKVSLIIAIILSILTVVLLFIALTMFFKEENGSLSAPDTIQETQINSSSSNKSKSTESQKSSDEDKKQETAESTNKDTSGSSTESTQEQTQPIELPRTGVIR